MCLGCGKDYNIKITKALSRERWRVKVSPARIVGGDTMSKRNLVIEEGSVEAMARLQKQDEEFCRRLRAAIETGRECCPTIVLTEPCTKRPVSNNLRPY
jgi:hypothetical protein